MYMDKLILGQTKMVRRFWDFFEMSVNLAGRTLENANSTYLKQNLIRNKQRALFTGFKEVLEGDRMSEISVAIMSNNNTLGPQANK